MLTRSTFVVTAPAVAIFIALLAGPARAQEDGDPEADQTEKADKPEETDPAKAAPEKEAPEKAEGPTAEDLEQAKAHFAKGRELFDAKDFESAVKEFKASYKLSKNPLLLYNIGFTLDELDDNKLALFYYKKFLEDAPKNAQNRDVVSKRVPELERELEPEAEPEKEESGEKEEKESAAKSVDSFQHNVIDEVPPGKPVDVTAFIPEGANWQVTLFYRSAGEARFDSTGMRKRYNELVGRIPAQKTSGVSTIQYYIEVKDRAGEVVDRSGRSTSPHLIFISEEAKPRYYPDLDTDSGFADAGGDTSGGGGAVVGGGAAPTPDSGRWTDVRSSKFQYTKWGVTGGAVGILALSATFYFLASDAGSSLEGEAVTSQMEQCPTGPPCLTFSDKQKNLQSKGKTFETLANVSLGVGIAAAAAAGAVWYWEIRESGKEDQGSGSVSAAPVLGDDFIGAAGALRF